MITGTRPGIGIVAPKKHAAELDLVVPFTTPKLTRAALDAASRMSTGLNAVVRLVRIQVVPHPLPASQSPVSIEFLKDQMSELRSGLPLSREIRLARSFPDGLLGVLTSESVVILAAPKRLWTTRNERLAASLRRAGHSVVLVNQIAPAASPETVHA